MFSDVYMYIYIYGSAVTYMYERGGYEDAGAETGGESVGRREERRGKIYIYIEREREEGAVTVSTEIYRRPLASSPAPDSQTQNRTHRK